MKALEGQFIKVKTSLLGFDFALSSAYANPAGLFFLCPDLPGRRARKENPMRKILFMIALMSAGRVWAIAPIGPAASDVEKGRFVFGLDYAGGEMGLDADDLSWTYAGFGKVDVPGYHYSYDVDVESYFARLVYGLNDRWQVFARFGQVEVGSHKDFAWGFGSKVTLRESERLDWGLMGQIAFLSSEYSAAGPDWVYYEEQADLYAIQVAFGPVYKASGFRLYGGPFLSWVNVDAEMKGDLILADESIVHTTGSVDLKKELEVGAYAGLSIDFMENLALNAEFQYASDWELFALSLSFVF